MLRKIKNYMLCKKFPFLKVRNRFDGKFCGYDFTELDALPQGWYDTFGIAICQDIKNCLKKSKTKGFVKKYRIAQIKEKWGYLHWYDNGVPSDISKEFYEIINKYEEISMKTCIRCGKNGKIVNNRGWYEPLCEECKEMIKKSWEK